MSSPSLPWPREAVCLESSSLDVRSLAAKIYARVCRTDFEAPGFCDVNAGDEIDSVAFRQLMIDLKRELTALHEARTGETLVLLSAARFDQQESTKPHLDGGPDECFLMLGYEPSAVESELEIFDYARCAFELGLAPKEFLARHNPMFRAGYDLLRPFGTSLPRFSPHDYHIVCINNSSAPYSTENPRWQGTLHTATILTPDESQRRVINSTMIGTAPLGTPDTFTPEQQQEFIQTARVRRQGYDKRHLEDDD